LLAEFLPGIDSTIKLSSKHIREKPMEQRLNDMEMLIMHQGHVIEQLNEVVTVHQTSIDRLAMELKIIKEHLRGMSSDNRLPSEEEPPPHY
jgi:SlyX protein